MQKLVKIDPTYKYDISEFNENYLDNGWKLIKILGSKFYKIRPVHGFSSQLTSAFVILGASIVVGPVSTTQVVSSSIMGVVLLIADIHRCNLLIIAFAISAEYQQKTNHNQY